MTGMSSSGTGALTTVFHALDHRIPIRPCRCRRLVLHVLGRMAGAADRLRTLEAG